MSRSRDDGNNAQMGGNFRKRKRRTLCGNALNKRACMHKHVKNLIFSVLGACFAVVLLYFFCKFAVLYYKGTFVATVQTFPN